MVGVPGTDLFCPAAKTLNKIALPRCERNELNWIRFHKISIDVREQEAKKPYLRVLQVIV